MSRRDQARLDARFALQICGLALATGLALLPILGVLSVVEVLSHPILWWLLIVVMVWRIVVHHRRHDRERLDELARADRREREQEYAARRATRPAGNVVAFERRKPADIVEFPDRGRAS